MCSRTRLCRRRSTLAAAPSASCRCSDSLPRTVYRVSSSSGVFPFFELPALPWRRLSSTPSCRTRAACSLSPGEHGGTRASLWQRRTLPHTAASAGPSVPIRRLLATALRPPPVWWALPGGGGGRCRSGHAVIEASTARRRLCATPWEMPASCRVARAEVLLVCGQVVVAAFSGRTVVGRATVVLDLLSQDMVLPTLQSDWEWGQQPPRYFFFLSLSPPFCVLFWQGKKKVGWAIWSCVCACV